MTEKIQNYPPPPSDQYHLKKAVYFCSQRSRCLNVKSFDANVSVVMLYHVIGINRVHPSFIGETSGAKKENVHVDVHVVHNEIEYLTLSINCFDSTSCNLYKVNSHVICSREFLFERLNFICLFKV